LSWDSPTSERSKKWTKQPGRHMTSRHAVLFEGCTKFVSWIQATF
jgi:hypothetical protein